MKYSKLEKQQVINDIKNSSVRISYLSKFKDDKDVMLEAVKQNGPSLYYASDRLKDNKDVVLAAVKRDGYALAYASKRLQNDRELLKLVEKVDISSWYKDGIKWHQKRMEVLEMFRNQEEKELMEKVVYPSNKSSKKLKF